MPYTMAVLNCSRILLWIWLHWERKGKTFQSAQNKNERASDTAQHSSQTDVTLAPCRGGWRREAATDVASLRGVGDVTTHKVFDRAPVRAEHDGLGIIWQLALGLGIDADEL